MSEVRILCGDALDGPVQCCVTSPPYWGLRDYGVEGAIGLEPTLAEHLERLVSVFREVRRVLRQDGTCWVNYGDAYSTGTNADRRPGTGDVGGWTARSQSTRRDGGLAPKQRLMLPARLALALQDDGWWIRSEIVWAKGLSFCPSYAGSCMPSSVTDRPTDSHEMLYLLSKAPRYFYDADAVREEHAMRPQRRPSGRPADETPRPGQPRQAWSTAARDAPGVDGNPAGRNLRTVWAINPQPFHEAHFATFPERLVDPCILAGTSAHGACSTCGAPWERVVEASGGTIGHDRNGPPRDAATRLAEGNGKEGQNRSTATYRRETKGWAPTCEHADAPVRPCLVLDPFSGSGTTGAVAVRLGRDYVGCELSPAYAEMSRKRVGRAAAEAGDGGMLSAADDERAAQLGLFGRGNMAVTGPVGSGE